MKTRLSPAAKRDLAEILQQLRAESRSGAIGFRERFGRLRVFLAGYPLAGRQTEDSLLVAST